MYNDTLEGNPLIWQYFIESNQPHLKGIYAKGCALPLLHSDFLGRPTSPKSSPPCSTLRISRVECLGESIYLVCTSKRHVPSLFMGMSWPVVYDVSSFVASCNTLETILKMHCLYYSSDSRLAYRVRDGYGVVIDLHSR